jgi:excinuclease ABC, C subunit
MGINIKWGRIFFIYILLQMETQTHQNLLDSIERFPQNPGVYIMKDTHDAPLYIGKAINLKSRVRSYFSDLHADRPHIPVMLQRLHHIEWIVTNNESEALILEANLIRKHKPRFNIDLKDDKHYPYLKVTINENFPRLLIVRKIENDGARYFGPYIDARAMRNLIGYARRIFKIRDCNKDLPLKNPVRPCVNFSINRCSGACAGKIPQEQYRHNVNLLIQFLRGYRRECVREMQVNMERASQETRFEDAAAIRDQIQLIVDASKLQKVDLNIPDINSDVFGIYKGDRSVCLAILHFREGLLLSMRQFIITRQVWEIERTNHETVLMQYYMDAQQEPPQELFIPDYEDINGPLMEQWFVSRFGRPTRVIVPLKGIKRQLVEMAEKNARLYCMQKLPVNTLDDLQDLQTLLKLPKIPRVIEAFDVSNIGGAFSVAGMVQFRDGLPEKSNYRRYKIKTVEGQNDFAMMMEAITRRLARLNNEQKPFADCLLIDGGLGQMHAAMKPMKDFSSPPAVIALAKKEELLYSPYCKEPVRLDASHPVRKLVERIRDEVHRWTNGYHRQLRGRQFKTTLLSTIPGIGPKKSIELLRTFGSVSGLKEASVDEIANVKGFSIKAAQKLKDQLKK